MRTADQLILSKTAHGREFGIAIRDMTVDIRGRYQPLMVWKRLLDTGHGKINAHSKTPPVDSTHTRAIENRKNPKAHRKYA